jgi:ketosteroid isomerase-like protein
VQDHRNAANYRKLSKATEAGDFEAYADAIADDIEWWEIGSDQPVRGKQALLERMQGMMGGDTSIKIDLHDVIANDEHMVALVTATVERGGSTLSYRTAEIYHVRDGKITHRWAFSDDTAEIIDFFA